VYRAKRCSYPRTDTTFAPCQRRLPSSTLQYYPRFCAAFASSRFLRTSWYHPLNLVEVSIYQNTKVLASAYPC
jgi:hypothetical protein